MTVRAARGPRLRVSEAIRMMMGPGIEATEKPKAKAKMNVTA
jgi:hypothetical protein